MSWPELRHDDWADTQLTFHLWTQVLGKVRLEKAPHANHWWQVPLYVTARGLGTSAIPDRERSFELELDLVDHRLRVAESEGGRASFKLEPMTVADFYGRTMKALSDLGIDVSIDTRPQEVPEPIPFERDSLHRSYDAEAVHRFWTVLVQAERVLTEFRKGFVGKASPVHLFWGALDLAATRFSGRPAPEHPGGVPGLSDRVTREAYSHEVSSAGFWPGGAGVDAAFYSYAYPEPEGFARAGVLPAEAVYSDVMKEFLLPYEAVRTAESPEARLLEFLESTYRAAADLGRWDRGALERPRARRPG